MKHLIIILYIFKQIGFVYVIGKSHKFNTKKPRKVMANFFRNVMLTGLGMASMTKDKIVELADKIAEESKLSREEGEKLLKDLLEKSEEAKQNIEEQVNKQTKKAMDKIKVPSQKEFEELKKRVEELEKLLKNKQSEQNDQD